MEESDLSTEGILLIPARSASERFPRKPLIRIAGKEMLLRVVGLARAAQALRPQIKRIAVTTDDDQIADFCTAHGVECIVVREECSSGTERIYLALKQVQHQYSFSINFQGDNPLCPPFVIAALVDAIIQRTGPAVATPCVQLRWLELDKLREIKKLSPFSGTSVISRPDGRAVWFTKSIVPAIRNETLLRSNSIISPVRKHIGVYAYTRDALELVPGLRAASHYMDLEGLEQLMFVEADIPLFVLDVRYDQRMESMPGINSPELVAVAEEIISRLGEPINWKPSELSPPTMGPREA
jgi:3-deoxy-manno-octulosonate cytidylyltransferase (CMP-KDO synthetase)